MIKLTKRDKAVAEGGGRETRWNSKGNWHYAGPMQRSYMENGCLVEEYSEHKLYWFKGELHNENGTVLIQGEEFYVLQGYDFTKENWNKVIRRAKFRALGL